MMSTTHAPATAAEEQHAQQAPHMKLRKRQLAHECVDMALPLLLQAVAAPALQCVNHAFRATPTSNRHTPVGPSTTTLSLQPLRGAISNSPLCAQWGSPVAPMLLTEIAT
jgi:hypothetical protein